MTGLLRLPDPIRNACFSSYAVFLCTFNVIGSVLFCMLLRRELEIVQDGERMLADSGTDPLTRVLNRRGVQVRCSRLLRLEPHGPRAVFLLDLDDFKSINDRFGHAAGDRALQLVAETFREIVRPEDLIGRLGGEQSVVIADRLSSDDALQMSERMRTGIASAVIVGNGMTHRVITTSIGASLSRAGDDLEDMIRTADVAL